MLTSVCALGSPALAFSRTSSKGVSTSPFAGPLTRENKQMDCHQAGPCHLSEEGRGRQEQTSAPGQERDSRCREQAPGSCFPGSKDHKAARRRFQWLVRARGGRQGTEGGTGNHRRPLSSLQPERLSSGLNGVLERSEGSSSKAPELENLHPNAQRPNKQTKFMFSKTVVYTHD